MRTRVEGKETNMANRSSRARLLFFLVIPCLASFLCMPLLAQDKG